MILGVALVCAAGVVPAASAASLRTAHRCYEPGATVRATARGFAPQSPLAVTLDGRLLQYGDGSLPSTDASGTFVSAFYAPYFTTAAQRQRRIAVSAVTGSITARTRFTITRGTGADFAPSQGNPRRLRVRFRLWGFALRSSRNARVYLHWVDPHRQVRASEALGRTHGACGTLRSARQRIFPFVAETGRWVLVIDTHRAYRRHRKGPRAKIPVHVRSLSL